MPSCLHFLYDLGPITIPSRHLHHVTPQRQYKEKGTTTQRGLDSLQLGLPPPPFTFGGTCARIGVGGVHQLGRLDIVYLESQTSRAASSS